MELFYFLQLKAFLTDTALKKEDQSRILWVGLILSEEADVNTS